MFVSGFSQRYLITQCVELYTTWRYKLMIEVKRPGEISIQKATKTTRFIFALSKEKKVISDFKSDLLYLLRRRKRCTWISESKRFQLFENLISFSAF